MDLGGWADANTMRKIYIHLAKRDMSESVEKIRKFYADIDNRRKPKSEPIIEIPTAKQLPSGSWRIQLRLGGERVSVTAATKEECESQARSVKESYKPDKTENRKTDSDMHSANPAEDAGSGSNIKIPKATQLPSGNWNIKLRLDCERVSVTEPTKEECENRARLIKSEHKKSVGEKK